MDGLQRRSRSWSPRLADEDDEESEVLFDACHFPRPTGDFLDLVLGEEPWRNVETDQGCKVRVVGEASALKRLFDLPLSAAGEALCLHRVGDCLVVLPAREVADASGEVELLCSPRVSSPTCQVRVDGDMVRIFPTLEAAEPVSDELPASSLPAACCEWRVCDDVSLVAAVPRPISGHTVSELSPSTQLRLLDGSWSREANAMLSLDHVAGSLMLSQDLTKSQISLPDAHRRVTEEKLAVLLVPLQKPLETRTLIDAWTSCCLYGSPSVLCFFVEDELCRGVRFVMAAELPFLEDIAKAYKSGAQRCIGGALPAFDPRALRRSSRSLLATLTARCHADGGLFLLTPSPRGPRLVAAAPDSDSEEEVQGLAEADAPRLSSALVTQALLMYHAAVRLSRPQLSSSGLVPRGARWSTKSCQQPLRVRRMMLRAVRALRAVTAALPRRFQLLLASAHEFLADSFFAEAPTSAELDISRTRAALQHLQKSQEHLKEYVSVPCESKFGRSVRELEERVGAKMVNAHLCLARLYQLQPWREGSSWGQVGLSAKELDLAEALVASRSPPGPYECSLLASISKWKAEHWAQLASHLLPSAEAAPEVYAYLEAQRGAEPPQPWPTHCERWLQSTVSLCLRAMHQLAAVPVDLAQELRLQARGLLARAYGKLGSLYASTGRLTKAMTHARQGVELFNATRDACEAAKLQLWLCRLQLRMALPQVSGTLGLVTDEELLLSLGGATPLEEQALKQVVQQLEKALKALDDGEDARQTRADGQALLGRVHLRQALVKLAKASKPFSACSLFVSEQALPTALELLAADGSERGGEVTKEAVERLQQAAGCLRQAGEALSGLAHLCLAYVYFCGRSEQRILRLASSHCQHALEQLADADQQLLAKLLAAKVSRLKRAQGSSGDVNALRILCDIALARLKSKDSAPEAGLDDSSTVRVLLGGDEQGTKLMNYIRQELSSILLRLLKSDLNESFLREMKTLYCSLLTAWHSEAGQVEALSALMAHIRKDA